MPSLVRPLPRQGSVSPPHSPLASLSSLEPLILTQLYSTFTRFDGARNDTFPVILHESVEKDKGKNLALRSFRFPPPVDATDAAVNPLHMNFNLKKVLVGKDYLRINHLLPLPFNLARGCTLLGNNVVPRLGF